MTITETLEATAKEVEAIKASGILAHLSQPKVSKGVATWKQGFAVRQVAIKADIKDRFENHSILLSF